MGGWSLDDYLRVLVYIVRVVKPGCEFKEKQLECLYRATALCSVTGPLLKIFFSNVGDLGLIPGRSPGEGNGYPLQYSCLENPMEREAWQSTVHEVEKSRTYLSDSYQTERKQILGRWEGFPFLFCKEYTGMSVH